MCNTFRASNDGIHVDKVIKNDDAAHVVLEYQLSSDRDTPVDIRLRDTIAADLRAEVRASGNGTWTVEEGSATYERQIAPDETVETTLEIPEVTAETLDGDVEPPDIEVKNGSSEDGPRTAAVETESVDRGADGTSFTFHGPETGSPPPDPSSAGSTDQSVAGEPVDTTTGGRFDGFEKFAVPEDDVELGDLMVDTTGASHAEVGSAYADEQTPENASEIASQREIETRITQLEEDRLAGDSDPSASVEARVRHLQSQFHDLAAYIDAMEAFIDEHGEGDHVLTELANDVERLTERLDRLDEQVDEVTGRLETVDDRLQEVESLQPMMKGKLGVVADSVEEIEDAQRSLADEVDAVRAFHDALQDAL